MNKLIVIPARGGSKGIPGKNIYPLKGKPLLAYTIEMIIKADLDNVDVVVSTDAPKIKEAALQYEGIEVVDRPDEISGDKASTEDALIHAVNEMERIKGKQYDAVLTLQPTSPLRKPETLKAFIMEYENNTDKYDALLSLTEDRTDFWICDNGEFGRLYPDAPRRRQDRKPLYRENSAYYITKTEALKNYHSVLGSRTGGFVIAESEGIDINEPVDLKIAEAFLIENVER